MVFLKGIESKEQLKRNYRHLAMQLHPDRGGDSRLFVKLNEEYERLSRKFELMSKGFEHLRLGDTVFVNGTECMVTFVGSDIFIAKAKGRSRKDVFLKTNGIGKYHPQFRASVSMNYRSC